MADEKDVKQAPAAEAAATDSSRSEATPRAEGGAPPRREGGYGGPRREGGRPGGSREGGPRREGRPGGREGGPGGPRKFFRRKKVCKFCVERIEDINYKDVRMLGQFVAESGKIVPRRITGVCTPHQRRVANAIKRARNIALLPFAGRQ